RASQLSVTIAVYTISKSTLFRALWVGQDPRHGQRADHRRYRDQGTPPGGSGRELAELPGHDLDELQEAGRRRCPGFLVASGQFRSEEHTSELKSPDDIVRRILLE